MGWIACVRCQKFRCEFVARTFALIAPVQPILHRFSCRNETIQNAPKHYKTHQFMRLESNGVDRVRSLRKTLMRFRGTNFFINCTSSTHFILSSVCNETLPNAPKQYEMLQNMSLVPMGWIECVLCEKFRCDFMAQTCALIAPVQPVLHRVSCSNKTLTNAPKHYENTPKHEFKVQWDGSRAFVAKNSMRFRTTNFCIYVQPVLRQVLCSNETNPKCTQTVRNTPI